MADHKDSDSPSSSTKRQRYSRVSWACVECRTRRVRCTGDQPCTPCEEFERKCEFVSTKHQHLPGAARTKILEARLNHINKYNANVQKDLTDRYSELLPMITSLQTHNGELGELFIRPDVRKLCGHPQVGILFTHLKTQICQLEQRLTGLQRQFIKLDKVITRFQNENMKFATELRNINVSPAASGNPQSNFEGTSDHSPSSGIPDAIDENPSSASNQNVSGRYSDSEMNEVVMDTGPAGSPLQLSIGEDQNWIFKEDQIVNWPLFYNQASLDLLSTQPQVEFAGQNATVFATHGGLYNPTVWVPLLKGSTWPYGNNSGQFTGTF